MAEVSAPLPLIDWLRHQRRMNELQLELMAERFDLDGALRAEQLELAWWAVTRIVAASARFYLYSRGINCSDGLDWTGNTRRLLDTLATIDPELAEELWQFLLRPVPLTMDGVRREVAVGIRIASDRFLTKQVDRDATVQQWADGVRLLREVAQGLKIAGADKWYLSADDSAAGLSWYDEVMAQLTARS
jgi:hypothetical protein